MQDAVRELEKVYVESGLSALLAKEFNEVRVSGREFAKLQFAPNAWRISSIEIWPTEEGPYFRIHYSGKMAQHLKDAINRLPGSESRNASTRVGASLNGDPLVIATSLAGLLRTHVPAEAGHKTTW